jgi:uncharacterized membrane protein YfcA
LSELLAILLGFLAGAVGGLLGVGGGILFVPALALFLDQSQLEAEATSLLAIVPVAVVGAWRQHSYGNVRLRDGLVVGALSPLGVAAGTVLANNVSQRTLEIGFACVVLLFAAQLVRRAFTEPRDLT